MRQLILLVICKDPVDKERDDYLFMTDVTLDGNRGSGMLQRPMDTFKNTKQFLGGQQLQTYKGQGPERAAALSLCL